MLCCPQQIDLIVYQIACCKRLGILNPLSLLYIGYTALLPGGCVCLTTFEFVHRLLVKQSLSHVTKRYKVNIQNTLRSTSRCTNLLLWPVCFVRHVVVDRFRVDRASRNEENWLRLSERLVRSWAEVHATVCGVKNCRRLLNCPRKKIWFQFF